MANSLHQTSTTLTSAKSAYMESGVGGIGVASTVSNGQAVLLRVGYPAMGSKVKRSLVAFDISSISGLIISASLTIKVSAASPTAEPATAYRLLAAWTEGLTGTDVGVSWSNRVAGGTAWGGLGAGLAGTDHTTTNSVAFNLPTSTSDLVLDVKASVQDAVNAGDSECGWLLKRDTEDGTNKAEPSFHSDDAAGSEPTLTITYQPAPYDDSWMECEELIGLPQDTTASVVIVCGTRSFGINDKVRIEYGTASDLTGSSTTTAVSLSGKSAGDAVANAITGLAANTRYYYRVEFSADGSTFPIEGTIRQFKTLVPATGRITGIITADHHHGDHIQNGDDSGVNHRLLVMENTHANIALERSSGSEWPEVGINLGDTIYAKHGLSINAFPLAADGTPDVGADKPYAYDKTAGRGLADVKVLHRLLRKTDYPFHSIPTFWIEGNHDAAHWLHQGTNNTPENNDAANWVWDTKTEYLGHPNTAASPSAGNRYISDNGTTGVYRWFPCGPILMCHLNVYWFSERGTQSPIPINFESHFQWTLGATQYDFFFHPTTGVIKTQSPNYPWVFIIVHNQTTPKGPPGKYGRGFVVDDLSTDSGEWGGEAAWISSAEFTAYGYNSGDPIATGVHAALQRDVPNKCVVLSGHDHIWAKNKIDDIWYLTLPQPASSSPTLVSPYNDGFPTFFPGGWKPSPGHVRFDATPSKLVLEYKRSYLTLSPAPSTGTATPSDGITTNLASMDTLVLSPSGGVFGSGKRTSQRFISGNNIAQPSH